MATKRICSIEGCGKQHAAHGYCNMHWKRLRRHGSPHRIRVRATCTAEGCERPAMARGWCGMHYSRWRACGHHMVVRKTAHGVPLEWLRKHVAHDGDECLVWPFAKNAGTYGRIRYDGRAEFVHRVMCKEARGPQPTPEHEVAHSCGNNRCVNPRHLRWATTVENQADRVAHGTSNRGSRHGCSKLSEDDVREIRSLHGKVARREIADRFGVRPSTVNLIVRGVTWGWLR